MLKGLALTPPIIGRIAIGKVVEKNGRLMPEKDDEFTITTQVQTRDGWLNHPLNETLRSGGNGQAHAPANAQASAKLRAIPVRLLFDDPDLNLRANYLLFDRHTGRPQCVGNGESCKRATASGIQSLPCAAPDGCEFNVEGHCKPYGRLSVRIGDDDELGSFVFRTTGFNSIRTLSSRLKYFHAVSGGLLSTLALELRLRGKSTTQSHRAPIYYVDLTVRTGMTMAQALGSARALRDQRIESGFDQAALDEAAREGFEQGAFEESAEEGVAVVEEFYPETGDDAGTSLHPRTSSQGTTPLADKLARKASLSAGAATTPASSG
jgi:hypothetical protein